MKYTEQSFTSGRNTDVSRALIPNNQYLEAHNLELVGDGTFYALQNIKGTTLLKTITTDATSLELHGIPAKFQINGVSVACIVYFTINSSYFTIYCYDTENNNLYSLFQEAYRNGFNSTDRVIEAVNYPENGIDHIYFSDNFNGMRYIKCVIPGSYSPNFLSSYDISLQRKGSVGSISGTVASGGSLLSGTYQFAYRLCDPANKRFTKWSSITNPFHVYDADNSTSPIHSAVGMLTGRKITITVTPATEEASHFSKIQLAVIENVSSTVPTEVSLLDVFSFSTTYTFDYKSNARIGTISFAELTVDQAQIDHVKSLRVSQNRLFAGNVTYKNLTFDNGTPSITYGNVLTAVDTSRDGFSSDNFASTRLGYFRDEVYRFGVVCEDNDGNKSFVSPLDLSGVLNNTISGGLTDMKFPSREYSNNYTLFNSNGYIQTLGLTIQGLTNLPSWTRKVHIVRVPRKKNIIAQTPIIPMSKIDGRGAFVSYPTNRIQNNVAVANTSAQPMTASTILAPRNMMWPEYRDIRIDGSNSQINYTTDGTHISKNFWMMWIPQNMYSGTPYQFLKTEKLDIIDMALMKMNFQHFDPSPVKYSPFIEGDDVNTNVSANFYALSAGDYYFDPTWSAKSINSHLKDFALTDNVSFDNLGQPTSLGGFSVMDYASLSTTGVSLGYQPSIQRSTVFSTNGLFYTGIPELSMDTTAGNLVFANGTYHRYNPGGYVVGSSGIKYAPARTNSFLNEYVGWTNDSYVNACYIANVKLGLGDDRYGDINSFHEYIETGATYTLTSSEVTTQQAGGNVSVDIDVWGGDCFVGPHLYKICDSTYSILNQDRNNGIAYVSDTTAQQTKWGMVFLDNTISVLGLAKYFITCLPVALENSAQYIQVVLESEYNGQVTAPEIIPAVGNVNGIPYYNHQTKESIRTPLSYNYNTNLSRGNIWKVYSTNLTYNYIQTLYQARIAYSNLKIYNSILQGFDVWNVGDFNDLPEQRYAITALRIAGDKMFAIQEQGIVFIPTGERQIEQTDASTLMIKSGDVIGREFIVDAMRGSQHARGIIETGGLIFIPDARNKTVYVLSPEGVQPITKDNETEFRNFFSSSYPERQIKGGYDPVRREYWLVNDSKIEVYNEKGMWIGDYEFAPATSVFQNGMWITTNESSNRNIYTMYTGSVNSVAGATLDPRVKVSVNPDSDFSKTFDVLMLPASDHLGTVDFTIENDSTVDNQTVTGVNIDVSQIEGNYRVPIPRGPDGISRLRGLRNLVTIHWKNLRSSLQKIHMAYDLSNRKPF